MNIRVGWFAQLTPDNYMYTHLLFGSFVCDVLAKVENMIGASLMTMS